MAPIVLDWTFKILNLSAFPFDFGQTHGWQRRCSGLKKAPGGSNSHVIWHIWQVQWQIQIQFTCDCNARISRSEKAGKVAQRSLFQWEIGAPIIESGEERGQVQWQGVDPDPIMSRNPHVNMCHRPKVESESGKRKGRDPIMSGNAHVPSPESQFRCHWSRSLNARRSKSAASIIESRKWEEELQRQWQWIDPRASVLKAIIPEKYCTNMIPPYYVMMLQLP